jgi:hypothetical protein
MLFGTFFSPIRTSFGHFRDKGSNREALIRFRIEAIEEKTICPTLWFTTENHPDISSTYLNGAKVRGTGILLRGKDIVKNKFPL